MEKITNNTPLSFLTVGEFRELLRTTERPAEIVQVQKQTGDPQEYAYGYQGIRDLLKVSHTKVWELKKTILKPAIIQHGRKLMVHKETALRLIAESQQEGGANEQ